MNKTSSNKMNGRAMRSVVSVIGTFVLALTAPAVMAQSSSKAAKPKPTPWPTVAPYDAAITAFDLALTEAARKQSFRNQLLKSSDSARAAVAKIGNMSIPSDRVMIFYEAAPGPANAVPAGARKSAKDLWESRSNENIHVFVLPPLDPNDTTKTYKYEDYFMCCYDAWRPGKP